MSSLCTLHLERTAAHDIVAANGLKNKWTFHAYKALQKIRQLCIEHAGHSALMKFALEIVHQQEAGRLNEGTAMKSWPKVALALHQNNFLL